MLVLATFEPSTFNPRALRVKIFVDGADDTSKLDPARNPLIQGFTTNPTLMRKASVKDYECFCRDLLEMIPERPFSFEVFSDEFDEIERQAPRIASWGENVYVKIPITSTRPQSYLSIFAGHVADAGCDPLPLICAALNRMRAHRQIELIWAGPRDLFNIVQADTLGCHTITVTHDLLKKLPTLGKDLDEFSLDTVKMFRDDAVTAGYMLAKPTPPGIHPTPPDFPNCLEPKR